VYFLPWWVLLACLAASAFATYLLLGRTQAGDSPWTLFPLTAVLAPLVLVGAAVVAIALSTLLSAPPEDRIGQPTSLPESPPPRTPDAARGYADGPCRRHGPRDEYPVRVPERSPLRRPLRRPLRPQPRRPPNQGHERRAVVGAAPPPSSSPLFARVCGEGPTTFGFTLWILLPTPLCTNAFDPNIPQ
jgi:hypothetical protein